MQTVGTVANLKAFFDETYISTIQKAPIFDPYKTLQNNHCNDIASTSFSMGKECGFIDEYLQGKILFLQEELSRKQVAIDRVLSILSANNSIIEHRGQNIPHKSCQICQLNEKEISAQTDKTQRKQFSAKDKSFGSSDDDESIKKTWRNEERIARNKQNLEK